MEEEKKVSEETKVKLPNTNPYKLGWKAMAVNVSDILSMGASPMFALLSIALPKSNSEWLKKFSRGFFACCKLYNAELIGGDTTKGPLSINVTVLGSVNKKNVISLSNKNIEEVLHYINICDLYIGNDSFGHHISSQLGMPSFILLLDTPKAYSDYSKNQIQIVPSGYDINQISHDTNANPNLISVDMILQKIQNFI